MPTTGRHRRQPDARIPEQRRGPRPIGITDAHTHVEQLITDESAMAHRRSGRYLALRGVQVLAASLTTPGRDQCRCCQQALP
jgi:hypothetical protein